MSVKVTKPGTLVFARGASGEDSCFVTGWHFVAHDGQASDEEMLGAVLRFVAKRYGVALGSATPGRTTFSPGAASTPMPENFDAQRTALDAIAIARWRDDDQS